MLASVLITMCQYTNGKTAAPQKDLLPTPMQFTNSYTLCVYNANWLMDK